MRDMNDLSGNLVIVPPSHLDELEEQISIGNTHPSTGGRILVVEDNASDAFLIGQMLFWMKLERFEFRHVQRLSEACNELSKGHFDCVLLDLTLSDGQGLEVLYQIKSVARRAPLIIVCGQEDHATANAAVRAGAASYVLKPSMDADSLAQSIHAAMNNPTNPFAA
jgi:DNA-binding NtrC family response regulator